MSTDIGRFVTVELHVTDNTVWVNVQREQDGVKFCAYRISAELPVTVRTDARDALKGWQISALRTAQEKDDGRSKPPTTVEGRSRRRA